MRCSFFGEKKTLFNTRFASGGQAISAPAPQFLTRWREWDILG